MRFCSNPASSTRKRPAEAIYKSTVALREIGEYEIPHSTRASKA
jgi:hypothetical protein